MKPFTCVVVGGGFAGIHAVKAIRRAFPEEQLGRKLNLILIDKQPDHLRKVLLFRPAVGEDHITVAWQQILPELSRFIQGTVLKLDNGQKQLAYTNIEGAVEQLGYDAIVMAAGSVARRPAPEQGGIALTDPQAAKAIWERWRHNMQLAQAAKSEAEKARLLSVAIAGAGITGIETAAELAYAMQEEAAKLGLSRSAVKVHLINAQERLFMEGPARVGLRLEQDLNRCGVAVHHRSKALREENGTLIMEDGKTMAVGLTVWTLGLAPNPALGSMGLPLTAEGQVSVDASYRVRNAPGVYSIGDCAHIVDPASGRADRMTCKEAIPQAARLGRVIRADLLGQPAPRHKGVMDTYAVGLGPNRGLAWTHKWGLDMIITGKLAYRIKNYVWDYASLLRG